MDKSTRKLHIIKYALAHWWVLNIVYGFGPHTSSLKSMDIYAKYKVLILKEEGNTAHVCHIYDQDNDKKYKASFRGVTSVPQLWISATISVLNSWCVVNVGLQDVNKILDMLLQ